jgi:integrase
MGQEMGRFKSPLSEKGSARVAKIPGMHAVGGTPGLYLYVTPTAASWILRYSFAGRRRDMGLGSRAEVGLAEARERAAAARRQLRDGIDPLEAKRERRQLLLAGHAKRMSFRAAATAYIDAHGDAWRNAKHRMQWVNSLETYTGPVFGDLDVSRVDTALVMKALDSIWKTKTETATRVRGRIEAVLDWATVRGLRHGENPARWKGHLDKLLPQPGKIAKVEHHAALPYREIGAFVEELRKQQGIGARALEFAILTAARSGEVRGAVWEEFDIEAGVWVIPAERMKARREHRVPLSARAVEIVQSMQGLSTFVFPGARHDKPLSDMTLTAALRRMQRGDLTAHGFRSTFRDWCAEQTAYPSEVAEMALAHTVGDKVEAAYRRGDLFEKRRRLMDDWAARCGIKEASGEVVPLRGKIATPAPAAA